MRWFVIKQVKGGNETILVIEDEYAIRRATEKSLQRYGYTVLSAENGEEGVEMYRERKDEIAMVVSDLMMPKMDGIQTYRALRKDVPDLKFLLVTGYATPEVKDSDLEATMLSKPWTIQELLKSVRDILDS